MGRKRKSEANSEMVTRSQPEPADQSPEKVTPLSKSPRRSMKKKKQESAASRRSGRLQSTIMNVLRQEIEPVFEEVLLYKSENENEQANTVHELPNPVSAQRSIDEKLDHLIELVGDLLPKAPNSDKDSNVDGPSMKYIDPQATIEKLTKENRELSLKLETAVAKLERTEGFEKERNELSQELKAALAKLEGFEKGMHVTADLLRVFKDLTVATTLAKATEQVNAARNADSQQPKTDVRRRRT